MLRATVTISEITRMIPAWLCIPFAGLLLSVALIPLLRAEWWEEHRFPAVLAWALLFILPFAALFGPFRAAETVLECLVNDYLSFIVMLFGLFCVAGNITFTGDLAGSPRVNLIMLTIGTLLSSVIGTTGSSMLMIRPMLKMNSWRRRKRHIMVFFIFLISNIGGCLTPLGDPPLLMGFMRGVPFLWSLSLFPVFLFTVTVLLVIFWRLDTVNYLRDVAEGLRPDISRPGTEIRFEGLHNLVFLLMIIIAVILSGTLPGLPAFRTPDGGTAGLKILGEVTLGWPTVIECVIILAAAFLSMKTTPEQIRRVNHFTWGPIAEVAQLFVGIFITMQPALMILKELGPSLGLTKPWEMFWATGSLSSFLDNTPTYLVFLTTAGTLGMTEGIQTTAGIIPQILLRAISCGAVFMGGVTYIGNAPNFMVKAISEENGIRMPSFFGYILWSLACLIPVFLLDTLVFFL